MPLTMTLEEHIEDEEEGFSNDDDGGDGDDDDDDDEETITRKALIPTNSTSSNDENQAESMMWTSTAAFGFLKDFHAFCRNRMRVLFVTCSRRLLIGLLLVVVTIAIIIAKLQAFTSYSGFFTEPPYFDGGIRFDESVVNQHSDLPVALLHFGPRKTATTSIQRTLSESKMLLAEDNFVPASHQEQFIKFLHFCNLNKYFPGQIKKQGVHCKDEAKKWEQSVLDIKNYHKDGKSFVYSDEGIPHLEVENPDPTKVMRELDRLTAPYRGNRYVTVTYRDYPDWIVSEYNQRNSGSRLSPTGTRPVDGFVDWYRATRRDKPRILHPLDATQLSHYQDALGPVYVFNMHELDKPENGLVVSWFCQALPWATKTCKTMEEEQQLINSGVMEAEPSSFHMNLSSQKEDPASIRLAQLHLNMHGNAWWKYAWWKKNVGEDYDKIVREAEIIQAWLSNMTAEEEAEVPLECLSESETQEIWETSVARRQTMVPKYDPQNIKLREKFDARLLRGDFCQIDYRGVSEMASWKGLWLDF